MSEFAFDKIKIDRSFISTMHERSESKKIVSAIVTLCRQLDIATVAEGIETRQDVQTLRTMGCQLGQGYLFSKPAPVGDIVQLTASYKVAAANPTVRAVAG